MSKVRVFGSIEKVDEQEDGTLIVHGIASTEAVDSQGEVVKADAMRAAIPDYMKFGAVREMHQPMAAGTALKCYVDDAGITRLEAHIVDPVAVKKVQAEVYKGFSIGGKVKKRDEKDKNIITALGLTEISLVDRPANPEATLSFGKVDGNDDNEANGGAVDNALETVKKYAGEEINDAACAISALDAIFYLLTKELHEDETNAEQVASLNAAIANLKQFIVSEIQETNPPTKYVEQPLAMADGGGDIEKAGARFSKATRDQLSALHKMVKDADEHLTKMGYAKEDGDEDADKSHEVEDLKKSHTETLAKAEALAADLAKATEANAELAKRVKELEDQPAPAKGAVMAVAKGTEVISGDEPPAVEPVRKGDGTTDDVATLIKSIHRGQPVAKI